MPNPSVGDKLGPYEIVASIGAGGMGDVYKARDTRLDRSVAIKISKTEFSERFEREARAVAALNHPNVCQLFDVGPNYLVMEYLEGSPLKGPLPLEQVLKYAVQICDALDAAHKKGITHRDLKPANILVAKTGIKLLDFGLAKLASSTTVPAGSADDATVAMALTGKNEIVGTLYYMSPEQLQAQANGQAIDARSDIFSFGLVLYEMLTGKRAFEGSSPASVIAAIMERPAPSVRELAPAALDRVISRCLEKDPDDRWQTARDLRAELAWISSGIASGGSEAPSQSKPRPTQSNPRNKWIWGAACLLVAGVAALAVWMLKPAPATPVVRTVIALDADEQLANLDSTAIAISPDGSKVAYVASRGGGPVQLFLRRLDALKAEPISGTEGATSPTFSPDSQSIAFIASGKLKKVALSGGAAITLCDVGGGTISPGAFWGPHDTILFQSTSGPFFEVPATGGAPRRAPVKAKSPYWRGPELTADGSAVVFAAGTTPVGFATSSAIAAATLDGTGTEKVVIAGGTAPRLTVAGDLVYAQNGTLMAVPFNAKRLELAGSPSPVLEGVRASLRGAAQYALSASGTLVYVPGVMQAPASRLVWVDREGKEQPLAAPARSYSYPRLSPDGARIGTSVSEATSDIWLYDIARSALSRTTFGSTNANSIWSPDGKRFAFQSDRTGAPNIYWQPADGSADAERLTTSQFINVASSWSPDGRTIAFIEINPGATGYDLWTLGLDDKKVQPFLKTQANETAPRFSPDGRWMAYASDESGRWEIYVRPDPGPGGKWQISTDGGTEPVWNPAGHELFYRSGTRMMAAPVTLQPEFSAGKPEILFDGPWLPTPLTFSNYDVSRDGKRFLMLKSAEQDNGARQIVVVQNWLEELKKRNK